jgi:heterotetrameric sarcosine oxidase delta subunit
MQLVCPWCGRRNSSEFSNGGSVLGRPDTGDVTPREWRDYLYLRDNTRGWVTERWYHRAGCRQFFVVERNTVTDETRDPRTTTVALKETETRTAESPVNGEAT